MSPLDTNPVFQSLGKYRGNKNVGETPRIIDKMTNFWRLNFLSTNWLFAILRMHCMYLFRYHKREEYLKQNIPLDQRWQG